MPSLPDLEHLDLAAFLQGAGLEDYTEDCGYLKDIVEVFLSTMPPAILELESAVTESRLPEIKRIAHSFKGAMPTFGAVRMGRLCEILDDAAKHHDLSTSKRLFPQLKIEFEGVLSDMQQLHRFAEETAAEAS
ncbi:MAG: multi-sensor hybrid histidine kinase [Puniceicoccaceae bacterium 5H]|nr:MAG: multi-sensor hybrid histidine kinase [Puniceicoccaceae bacterium 5H]